MTDKSLSYNDSFAMLSNNFRKMSSFRTQTWDPSLIVGQIFCMQSVFYSSECLFMFLYSYTGYRPTLDHVFAAQVHFIGRQTGGRG